MGLDITAVCRIERIGNSYEYGAGIWIGAQPDEFTAQANGIKPGLYQGEDVFCFRAGSYSSYNHWRDALATLAGYSGAAGAWEATEGPFWELINFSDCEGVIGSKTAAKLAKDFAEHQAKADTHEDAWFRELYTTWRCAFELASNEGAVVFH